MKIFGRILVVLVAVCLAAGLASAQTTRGDIQGRVGDEAGIERCPTNCVRAGSRQSRRTRQAGPVTGHWHTVIVARFQTTPSSLLTKHGVESS